MKFGLVGTGHWALTTHGLGLGDHPDVELVGVWGRDFEKSTNVANELGTKAYENYDDLLNDVDAVSFAVDPVVQGELALKAAQAGKHLLLDKPVALDPDIARQIEATVREKGLGSIVFFTIRFAQADADWLATLDGARNGGWVLFLVNAYTPGSPYANSPWRKEKGGLWDVGPHALSVLDGGLGPIVEVTAVGGEGDLAHLILKHESGATSTVTLSLTAPIESIKVEMNFWGKDGIRTMPSGDGDALGAYRRALDSLLENIASGKTGHPCDVHLGTRITEILASAESQITSAGSLTTR